DAAQGYAQKTGRRVSYEWVMLAGVNDTDRDAHELGALLKGKHAHVNLIPFNPVEDTPYHAPDRASIRRFKDQVAAEGLNVTLRERLGPVPLQFPPTRQKNLTLLDSLLSALGRPAAAEFRHESWFAKETYRVLREHAGALVVTDEAKWPRAPLVDLGAVAYFRLRRGYTAASLRPWVADVASALAAHEEVHVYFKHDLGSPALARRLLGLAAKESASR